MILLVWLGLILFVHRGGGHGHSWLASTYPVIKFDEFSNTTDLWFLGDAYASGGKLHLTNEHNASPSSGTVIHKNQFHLRDCVNSFSTKFSFSVGDIDSDDVEGGLTFFLTPNNHLLGGAGPFLGLIDPRVMGRFLFVAVEFDARLDKNFFDPNGNHVGVDVNTVVSLETGDLGAHGVDLLSVELVFAWVVYMCPESRFSIYVSPIDEKPEFPIIEMKLNISEHLQDFIYMGFSASTQGGIPAPNLVDTWEVNLDTWEDI